jgi:hypothetical protein
MANTAKTKAVAKKTTAELSTKRAKPDKPTLTENEKRVVMIQYNKENESDAKTGDELLEEYLKFMQVSGGDTPPLQCNTV